MRLQSPNRCCPVCGEILDKSQFHNIKNTSYNGTTPICKQCIAKQYEKYYNKLNRPDAAMWCVCAENGIPFISSVWDAVVENYNKRRGTNTTNCPATTYLKKLDEVMPEYEGFYQSDKMLDAFMELNNVDNSTKETAVELERRRDKQRKEWGEFSEDALDWLDNCYKDYTDGIGHMDKITEARYRDLCKAEWLKRVADQNGDIAEINKARDNISAMLKMLHLDNFKGNDRSDEDKRIERIIWNIENTEPAECEDLNKYRDFSGLTAAFNDLKRTMQNLVCGSKDYPNIPRGER